jgi:2-keto-4-pentenoate hydratase/2-oxohepta-3-ene-1,7-dioic acid hydratase in catechol pathway
MRLVTYETGWARRAGILVDSVIVDAARLARSCGLATDGDHRFSSTRRILQSEAEVLRLMDHASREVAASAVAPPLAFELAEVTLGPPVPDPGKIICVALNYSEHAQEAGFEIPEGVPPLFPKFSTSLVGPEAPIVIPAATSQVDYEGELAVVIGRTCKEVLAADAIDCLAGAMVFNDVSARDTQKVTNQLLNAKALDTFGPCGPALVLMDEVGDLQNLRLTTRLNGEVVQDATTALMIHSIARLIEYTTSLMTLHPGDIIATGTPSGVGAAADPPRYLEPGDLIEVGVEGLGWISNPVVTGAVLVPPYAPEYEGSQLPLADAAA